MALFSLAAWSRPIPARLLVPRCTWGPHRRPLAFAYGAVTLSRRPFNAVPLASGFLTPRRTCRSGRGPLYPPLATPAGLAPKGFGLFRVRSPLLPESLLFSFPVGTEMVHFPTFAPLSLFCSAKGSHGFRHGGFPHSDIPGSKPACGSPRLFAAYHVLRRGHQPRHPPSTLVHLALYQPAAPAPYVPAARPQARRRILVLGSFSASRASRPLGKIERLCKSCLALSPPRPLSAPGCPPYTSSLALSTLAKKTMPSGWGQQQTPCCSRQAAYGRGGGPRWI